MSCSVTIRRWNRLVLASVSARVVLGDPYTALNADASLNHCSATPATPLTGGMT